MDGALERLGADDFKDCDLARRQNVIEARRMAWSVREDLFIMINRVAAVIDAPVVTEDTTIRRQGIQGHVQVIVVKLVGRSFPPCSPYEWTALTAENL